MNAVPYPPPARRGVARWLGPIALCSALLLAACGGGSGGSSDDGGRAATQTLVSGRITGFGSVIVNGVRFDDSTARIVDDDGNSVSRADLGLGMVVRIHGSRDDDSAVADEIVVVSELKGPVESVDAGAGTLVVLGQTVRVDAATVYDGVAGIAGLAAGALVEVYAFDDPTTGGYLAARIETKDELEHYRLVGAIDTLDTTAETFTVNGATVDYGDVPADERPTLAVGTVVKARLATAPVGGAWVAIRLKVEDFGLDDDRDEAEVEGLVSGFVSLGDFRVGGIRVDASAAVFEDGPSSAVADGVRVEVEGDVVDGVLVARKVEFEDGDGDDDDALEVELHGAIEAVDAGAKTFVLRGVTVRWDALTRLDDGLTVAEIAAGLEVEVEGRLAEGGVVVAETIEVESED